MKVQNVAASELRAMQERAIKDLQAQADLGRGTATTVAKITDGLTCSLQDGPWQFVADEMPGDGGAGLGPDPGVYGRAALASCLAMGYVFWAARLEVAITSVEVSVEADYDARGMLGIDDSVSPGWSAVRYQVSVESPAPKEKVIEVIETADRYSPLLADFRQPLAVSREATIVTSSID